MNALLRRRQMMQQDITSIDTNPVVMQENAVWNSSMAIATRTGACITKIYEFEFDEDELHASSYYDPVNDYMTVAGWCRIKYYFPTVKFTENGYSFSGSNYKFVVFKDGAASSYGSPTRNSDGANWNFNRQSSNWLKVNGVSFTLTLDDREDSYAYWDKMNANCVLPIGVRHGDIIFAGKNTVYYGHKNISEVT